MVRISDFAALRKALTFYILLVLCTLAQAAEKQPTTVARILDKRTILQGAFNTFITRENVPSVFYMKDSVTDMIAPDTAARLRLLPADVSYTELQPFINEIGKVSAPDFQNIALGTMISEELHRNIKAIEALSRAENGFVAAFDAFFIDMLHKIAEGAHTFIPEGTSVSVCENSIIKATMRNSAAKGQWLKTILKTDDFYMHIQCNSKEYILHEAVQIIARISSSCGTTFEMTDFEAWSNWAMATKVCKQTPNSLQFWTQYGENQPTAEWRMSKLNDGKLQAFKETWDKLQQLFGNGDDFPAKATGKLKETRNFVHNLLRDRCSTEKDTIELLLTLVLVVVYMFYSFVDKHMRQTPDAPPPIGAHDALPAEDERSKFLNVAITIGMSVCTNIGSHLVLPFATGTMHQVLDASVYEQFMAYVAANHLASLGDWLKENLHAHTEVEKVLAVAQAEYPEGLPQLEEIRAKLPIWSRHLPSGLPPPRTP